MAQKDIHPKLYDVKFVMPDGEFLIAKSTYSKSDTIHCEKTIKQVLGGKKEVAKGQAVDNFNKRFGNNNIF
ncbi:MAG: 50S ribosomal protein L31 [Sphingobacteriia bacterium]|nr:50S ribosomal protein L31 [Sphingobacteriia bacterium]